MSSGLMSSGLILVISYLAGVAMLDALRRPHSWWITADRPRTRWLWRIGLLSLFGLGAAAAIAYGYTLVAAAESSDGPRPGLR